MTSEEKYAVIYDLIEKLETQVTVETTGEFFKEMIRLYRSGDTTQVVDFACMALQKNIKFPNIRSSTVPTVLAERLRLYGNGGDTL